MKQIVLEELTLIGFKSFEHQTIQFPEDGFVLIAGDNQLEPRLGANGAGKSSIFDGIAWVLYGTSVRGVRTADLIRTGHKTAEGRVALDIDGTRHEIARSGPPARLFLDGRQVEQAAVDRLVGMSRLRFLHSVVFGQAVPLFIDLPVPKRGELLDEILDLEFWMRAADRAGKQTTAAERRLAALRTEIGRTEGALSQLESDVDLAGQEEAWASARDQRMRELLDKFEQDELALAVLQRESAEDVQTQDVDALGAEYHRLKRAEAEIAQRIALREQAHAMVLEDIQFFKGAGDCPVCNQPITREFAEKHLGEQRQASADHVAALKKLNAALAEARVIANEACQRWEAARRSAEVVRREAAVRTERVRSAQRALEGLERQVEQLAEEANPYTVRRRRVDEDRKRLDAQLATQQADEISLATEAARYDFWRQGFRRVRLFCIERVLKQLELETMNAAQSLGLAGWKINFSTETETRAGTSKMGVQVTVQSPALSGIFDAWSGGEGQRVRLCVALGLSGLIQRWAGVRWNLEVYDEPTAWLSEAGIEDLLDFLRDRADVSGKPVFLCDHRALAHAGFSKIMTVVKDENGSRMVQ